jgi:hypothetical protein
VARLDRRAAERDREMRLTHAWGAEDEHVFAERNEAARGELAHEPMIDRRLKPEIEVLERLHAREVGDLDTHRDAFALLGVDLLAQHAIEEVQIRRLSPGGIGEQGIEPLGAEAEPQSLQMLDDTRLHHGAHRRPPITAA